MTTPGSTASAFARIARLSLSLRGYSVTLSRFGIPVFGVLLTACAPRATIVIEEPRRAIDAVTYMQDPPLKKLRHELYEIVMADSGAPRDIKLKAMWRRWLDLDREIVPVTAEHRLHLSCTLASLGLLTSNDSAAATYGARCPPSNVPTGFPPSLRDFAQRIQFMVHDDDALSLLSIRFVGTRIQGAVRLEFQPIDAAAEALAPFEIVVPLSGWAQSASVQLAAGTWRLRVRRADGAALPKHLEIEPAQVTVRPPAASTVRLPVREFQTNGRTRP